MAAAAERGPRISVRARPLAGVLTAQQTTAPSRTELPSGEVRFLPAGGWIVSRGDLVVDALSDAEFAFAYERVERETLVLTGADRHALGQALGVPEATQTPQHLLTAVQRLARIRIGDIALAFTPGQLEEIAARAEKRGWSVKQYTQYIADRILQDFWQH